MQVDGFGAMIAIVFRARAQTLLVLESCTPAMFDRDRDNCGVFRARSAGKFVVFSAHGVIWLLGGVDVVCTVYVYRHVALLSGTWRDGQCLEKAMYG